MAVKVVIRPVGYAPKLAPTEGEQELEVRRGFGVKAQLVFFVVS